MSEEPDPDEGSDREHLESAPDGCGCTEMWEHLSEQRAEAEAGADDDADAAATD